jgi:hypothetical protein
MRNTIFVCLATLIGLAQLAQAQEAQRAEVLVLGVYHMANPGQDVFNMKADDPLAPKRGASASTISRRTTASPVTTQDRTCWRNGTGGTSASSTT